MIIYINEDLCLGDCCKLCNSWISNFYNLKRIEIKENNTYEMIEACKFMEFGCPERAIIIEEIDYTYHV